MVTIKISIVIYLKSIRCFNENRRADECVLYNHFLNVMNSCIDCENQLSYKKHHYCAHCLRPLCLECYSFSINWCYINPQYHKRLLPPPVCCNYCLNKPYNCKNGSKNV